MSYFIPDLVSTIIPVFNREKMIIDAVQSVLQQTYQNLEIIIADDGSTDKTPQVCEELVRKYPGLIKFVRINNSGPGPAREAGRQHASGEFIQYLDSDDNLTPNKFTDQVNLLKQHPEVDIAFGKTNLVNSEGVILKADFKWTDRNYTSIFPYLLVDRWWCTHTPLYRRSLTDRIGPWCSLRWSQDWEYDARAGALNAKIMNCQTHVSNHVHHDGVRQTNKADFYKDRTRLLNRVDLLTALWKYYLLSDIIAHGSEVAHFSRWSFFVARSAAFLNLKPQTIQMLNIAQEAAKLSVSSTKLMSLFNRTFKTLGCNLTGKLFNLAQSIKPGRSKYSQKQAFEE